MEAPPHGQPLERYWHHPRRRGSGWAGEQHPQAQLRGGRRRAGTLALLVQQFQNPIILILVFASVLVLFLGDAVDAGVILAIVLLSGFLGFWRERGAAGAVQALVALVSAELAKRRFYRRRVHASTDRHRLEPAQRAG